MRIVDVIDRQDALRAVDDAAPVRIEGDGCHQLRHFAIAVEISDVLRTVNARTELLHAAFNAHNVVAEHHRREIQRIHAHVQQCAARQFRLANTLLVLHIIRQIGGQEPRLTDFAGRDDVRNHPPRGHIARPDGFCDVHPRRFRFLQDFFRLLRVCRKRFFAQHRLSRRDALANLLRVMAVWRGDINQLHQGVV